MLKMVPSGLRTTISRLTGIHQSILMFVPYIQKKIWKIWSISTSQPVFLPISVVRIR